MTCISFRNTGLKLEKRVLSIFEKMGKTLIIPEEMMGAATVVEPAVLHSPFVL
jgi:pyrroline-5-carboxylate reductase